MKKENVSFQAAFRAYFIAGFVALAFAGTERVGAQVYSWNTGAGSWSGSANWTPGLTLSSGGSSTTALLFGPSATAATIVTDDLGASVDLAYLQFTGTQKWTVATATGDLLNLWGSASPAGLPAGELISGFALGIWDNDNQSGGAVIQTPIKLQHDIEFLIDLGAGNTGGGEPLMTIGSSTAGLDLNGHNLALDATTGVASNAYSQITIAGAIGDATGTGTISKYGVGLASLSDTAAGAFNFGTSGATDITVYKGALQVAASAYVGNGNIDVMNGATLDILGGTAFTENNGANPQNVITLNGGHGLSVGQDGGGNTSGLGGGALYTSVVVSIGTAGETVSRIVLADGTDSGITAAGLTGFSRMTINTELSGGGGATIYGAVPYSSFVMLTNANSAYGGGTTVGQGGYLVVGYGLTNGYQGGTGSVTGTSAGYLGTGTIDLDGGTLATFTTGTFDRAITVSGPYSDLDAAGSYGYYSEASLAAGLAAQGPMKIASNISATGGNQVLGVGGLGEVSANFIAYSEGQQLELTGVLSDGADGSVLTLDKTGDSYLILDGTSSTYTGGTVVSGGVLAFDANVAASGPSQVGTGTVTLTGGGIGANTAGIDIARNLVLGTAYGFTGTDYLDTLDNFSISGRISGSGPLVKRGAGTVALTNTANSFSGGLTIASGGVSVDAASELGLGQVTVGHDGWLALTADTGSGILSSISSASTGTLALDTSFASALDLSGFANLYLGSSTTGTYTAATLGAQGANYLLGGGWGTLTFSGAPLTGSKGVTVSSGTIVLQGADAYTGVTTVNGAIDWNTPGFLPPESGTALAHTAAGLVGGTLALNGGTINQSSALKLDGGTLAITATGSGQGLTYLNGAANLEMNNGTLTLAAGPAGANAATVDTLALDGGADAIALSSNGGSASFTATDGLSAARTNLATLNVSLANTNGGTSSFSLGTGANVGSGILPWLTITTNGVTTFGQLSGGTVSALAATETSKANAAWDATTTWTGGAIPTASDDVTIANNQTLSYTVPGTPLAVDTLTFAGTALLNFNGGTRLNFSPTDGGIVTSLTGSSSVATIFNTALNFGTGAAYIYDAAGTTLNLGNITSSNGFSLITAVNLVKSGAGTLDLGGAIETTLTGVVYLQGGTLITTSSSSQFPSASGIDISGGSLFEDNSNGGTFIPIAFSGVGGVFQQVGVGNLTLNGITVNAGAVGILQSLSNASQGVFATTVKDLAGSGTLVVDKGFSTNQLLWQESNVAAGGTYNLPLNITTTPQGAFELTVDPQQGTTAATAVTINLNGNLTRADGQSEFLLNVGDSNGRFVNLNLNGNNDLTSVNFNRNVNVTLGSANALGGDATLSGNGGGGATGSTLNIGNYAISVGGFDNLAGMNIVIGSGGTLIAGGNGLTSYLGSNNLIGGATAGTFAGTFEKVGAGRMWISPGELNTSIVDIFGGSLYLIGNGIPSIFANANQATLGALTTTNITDATLDLSDNGSYLGKLNLVGGQVTGTTVLNDDGTVYRGPTIALDGAVTATSDAIGGTSLLNGTISSATSGGQTITVTRGTAATDLLIEGALTSAMTIAGNGNTQITASDSSNLTVSGSGSTQVSGPVSGSLTFSGSGDLTMTGLQGTTGFSFVLTNSGSGTLIDSGNVLSSVATSGSGSTTISGAITGTGSVSVGGTSFLLLTGANTSTGAMTVNGGTLQIGNGISGSALGGGVTIQNGGTIAFDMANGSTGANAISAGTAGGIVKGLEDAGVTNILSGKLANAGLAFVQAGAGTTVLTNSGNNYTGGTTVDAGTLQLSGAGTLGSTTGVLSVAGGTLDVNGTHQTVGASSFSGGTIADTAGGGALTATSYTASNSGTVTVNANLTGATNATFTQSGSGTTILNGTNTFTNDANHGNPSVSVTAGRLLVNGSLSGYSVQVAASGSGNALLGGRGTISTLVSVGGGAGSGTAIIDAGGSGATGTLALSGGLVFAGTNEGIHFDLDSAAGAFDQLNVTGAVDLLGGNSVSASFSDLANGNAFSLNQVLVLVQTTGFESGVFGSFTGYADGSDITIGNNLFQINYGSLGGSYANDITLTDMGAVPEPDAAWLLAAAGLAGGGVKLVRRARRA